MFLDTALVGMAKLLAPGPEVQSRFVNFNVTETGLDYQVLLFTVVKKRPDLASLKKAFTAQQNTVTIQLSHVCLYSQLNK